MGRETRSGTGPDSKKPARLLLAGFFGSEEKRAFFFEPAKSLANEGIEITVLEHGRDVCHELPYLFAPAHLFRQPVRDIPWWRSCLSLIRFCLRHPRTVIDCIRIDFLVIGSEKQYANDVGKQWKAVLGGLRSAIWQISREIDVNRDDLVVCFGSNYPWQRLLGKLCNRRAAKLIFAEYGSLHGFVHFSETSVSYGMFPIRCRDRFLDLPVSDGVRESARRYIAFSRAEGYEIRNQAVDRDLVNRLAGRPQKKIFVPAIGLLGGGFFPPGSESSKRVSPYFRSNEDVVKAVLRIAQRNEWLVLYKPHPNSPPVYDSIPDSPNLFRLEECHIPTLIDIVDVVACLGTKVSQGAIARGKPVVMLGDYVLSGMGVCYEYHPRGPSLEELITEALRRGLTENQIQNYERYAARELQYLLYTLQALPIEGDFLKREDAFASLLDFYADRIDAFPFAKGASMAPCDAGERF